MRSVFALSVILLLTGTSRADAQTSRAAVEHSLLQRYTKGVTCDRARFRWIAVSIEDSTSACRLAEAAMREVGRGAARKFGVGAADTASVKCVGFTDAIYPYGGPKKDRHLAPPPYWTVTLVIPHKALLAVQFDRSKRHIEFYLDEGGFVWDGCGLEPVDPPRRAPSDRKSQGAGGDLG